MDNSFHVVTATGVNSSARLGGVTVRAGGATGELSSDPIGAGILLDDGGDLAVTNCTIVENCALFWHRRRSLCPKHRCLSGRSCRPQLL